MDIINYGMINFKKAAWRVPTGRAIHYKSSLHCVSLRAFRYYPSRTNIANNKFSSKG